MLMIRLRPTTRIQQDRTAFVQRLACCRAHRSSLYRLIHADALTNSRDQLTNGKPAVTRSPASLPNCGERTGTQLLITGASSTSANGHNPLPSSILPNESICPNTEF